jgi:hypothetical protein
MSRFSVVRKDRPASITRIFVGPLELKGHATLAFVFNKQMRSLINFLADLFRAKPRSSRRSDSTMLQTPLSHLIS